MQNENGPLIQEQLFASVDPRDVISPDIFKRLPIEEVKMDGGSHKDTMIMSDVIDADRKKLGSRGSTKLSIAEKVHPTDTMEDKIYGKSATKFNESKVPLSKLEGDSSFKSANIAAQPLQYIEREVPKTSQGKRPGRANPEPQVVWGQMQGSSGESLKRSMIPAPAVGTEDFTGFMLDDPRDKPKDEEVIQFNLDN